MSQFWELFPVTFLVFILASVESSSGETDAQTYIIRIQNDLKPSAFSDAEEWYSATLRSLDSTSQAFDQKPNISHARKKSQDFLHAYKTVFHGFSARLTTKQAQELKNRPGVLAVLPDKLRQLQTTRSPQFLGISSSDNPAGLLKDSDSGSNIVIGLLDTGIWPEHRSFHDEGLGPIPSHWKGECTEGEKFTKNHCNKKIIGARYFASGYEARNGRMDQSIEVMSPRDTDGHGTHTAATAAGRAVSNATLLGFATGVAAGMAPKARIAVYKICWKRGCMESDILAAFDKAVEDGVDVISISVGGGAATYNLDPIAIGAFGAMEKGVFVSASAGNEGPNKFTVTNVAPWITSVGASTIDRKFPANLVLKDGQVLRGSAIYHGHRSFQRTPLPLIYGGNASIDLSHGTPGHFSSFSAGICMPGSLDTKKVKGKIVVCDRGGSPRVAKGEVVRMAGGLGVIVANVAPLGEGLIADAHIIPGLALGESDGNNVRTYINSTPDPRARMVFQGTQVGVKPAPVVASFSSRGPNGESIYVLKPDIIAPGVNILAAWPDGVPPTELPTDTRRTNFNIVSGTSMSCPHVSGIAALLKGAHPDWSPAMIRSALMTTAYMHDRDGRPLLDETSYQESTVWDTGAGHVNPEKALDPGLVYDLSSIDFVNFLCASNYSREAIKEITRHGAKCPRKHNMPWDINYPAVVVVFDKTEMSDFNLNVTRTVTNVGEGASSYSVVVTNPKGSRVSVNPPKMDFSTIGQKQSFVVQIKGDKLEVAPGNAVTEWGMVTWSDGKHQVGSPVIVVWRDVF
ncbi:subtilisin-like protease SBT1.5 [Coffea arabica]|uniref:Subtilisin-like protease SBT1.5 n=1 Tax=Coffea arabica TaxID=13443 RepID=A0ABM4WHK6_COFAR